MLRRFLLAAYLLILVAHAVKRPYDLLKFDYTEPVIHDAERNSSREISLSFHAFNQTFLVFLHLSPTSLYPSFKLHNGDGYDRRMELLRSTRFYTGTVNGWSFSRASVIFGTSDNEIYAKLENLDDILYIEPATNGSNLVYWNSDLVYRLNDTLPINSIFSSSPSLFSYPSDSFFKQFIRSRRAAAEVVRRNRCELKLVADYAFYNVIGNKNYANAARYLVNLIERVNDIFTKVDWGINSNNQRLVNMGFVIKEMKILDKPTNSPVNHFNSEISNRVDGYFEAFDILKSFSIVEGTGSACLTYLVSGKIFASSVLGSASIGQAGTHGLCARKPLLGDIYSNTGIVSVQRRSGLMITRIVDLIFAHEMGHSWGSGHDNRDDKECISKEPENGRYIMHESSNSGYDKNNFLFSPCSMRSIHRLLYDVAENCFVSEQDALCGNGILEAPEQCDPGGQLSLGRVAVKDRCCTSNCRLRAGAKCSPRHSECCSADCSYLPENIMCQSRSPETCKRETFCTGHNDKCPEPLSVADNTTCADEGQCKLGECISFCQLMSPNWTPCICEDVDESCFRCCRNPDNKVCMPVKPLRHLPEGAICIHGQCHKNECVKEATDAATHFWRIIKDIGTNPSPKYFADYIVFIVIAASLCLWCPCGVYILFKDRQKRQMRETAIAIPQYDVKIVSTTKKLKRNIKPTETS
ncbi:hypothetical protein M3Y96_00329600 [Aphelenchoides besseyi]|nr:hypothetical protein M3Y96_00329600 [Aphelenchoides besseyi]